MSRSMVSLMRLSMAAIGAIGIVTATTAAASAAPAKPTVEASRIDTYTKDGATYFALSLQPAADAAAPAESRDIVVLFDTSASQTGEYRDKALAVLQNFLSALGPKDRVHLMSVDINAVPMTKSFVGAKSEEMQTALANLVKRVPLGSTDMSEAYQAAVESFSDQSAAARATIYIGDGVNNAGAMGDELRKSAAALADARASTSSFAVGPQINGTLLAAVANQTGGMFIADAENYSAKDAGMHLGRAVQQPVIWVESAELPKMMTEVYPQRIPPLRADRETIVIGKGNDIAEELTIKVAGQSAGTPVEVSWQVPAAKENDENAYLVSLVELARPNRGMDLPTVGAAGLAEARRMLNAQARGLAQLGKQAAASGDKATATRLAAEAVRRDPNNLLAQDLSRVAQIDEPGAERLPPPRESAPPAPREGDLRLVRPRAVAEDPEGGFLDEVIRQRDLIIQKLVQDVTVALRSARDRMGTDPRGVEQDLKLMLDRVDQVPELTAEVRSKLRNQLVGAIREASRNVGEVEAREVEAAQRQQAAELQRLLNERLVSREQRIAQLIERMNALLSEGRYQDAEYDAARIAYELDPTSPLISPVTHNATLVSRAMGFTARNATLRDEHNRAIIDTLLLVDKANVPFPDEPPIVYPAADVWLDLTRRRAKYKAVDLSRAGPAEEKIYEALDNETDLEFNEVPLRDAVEYIKDKHGIEIQLDEKALTEAVIATDTPVTRNVKGISLRSALRLMLRPLQLTYMVQNEVLLITTQAEADMKLVTKVYPVADLVLPINAGGGINPFALGGLGGGAGGLGLGGGGGFGGGLGGGGLGGGGFGGGGFGGGGFGGGLGGGGFGGAFNVLDEEADSSRAGPAAREGAKAFVAPDLKLKKSPTASAIESRPGASANPAKPATTSSVNPASSASKSAGDKFRVELKVAAGADRQAAWDQYFKTLDERAGIDSLSKGADRFYRVIEVNVAVRDAARRLMKDQNFADVTAMIRAALRNGHAQPWMYEAMGLAMQAAGEPKEEIERALMSAVDFAASTDELMHAALYMSRIGLEKRALRLLRQAATLEPTRCEPFAQGLPISERSGDLDAIQWACTGVLGRAWTNDQLDVIRQARQLATATLERLRKEKKTDEAKRFETALNEALVRDLVVRVSWTGDADIDLAVEEPAGTVCSLQNPRTIAGGVLLGDSSTSQKSEKTGYVEDYVVPQAYSGDYRVLIRRVWGKVTAGKVTVDIVSHYGTKKAEHQQQQIPIGEKDALVTVNLKDGRRQEPLELAQVAVLANKQQEVGKAVLAQQLSSMSDTGAMRDLAVARQLQAENGLPFFRRGGNVGFMPVITTLPEGTNMSAIAVVSADRRYVRITPTPLFSSIPEVNTFNFATGQGQQQQGALGGIGGQAPGVGGGFGGGGFGGGGGIGGGGFF
jgi:hypothetical protein